MPEAAAGAATGAASGSVISPGVGTVIGSLIGTAGGLVSSIFGHKSSKKQLEWTQYAQRKAWEREDTAVQRRAADLQAAGFNRLLAAGSGAASSAPVHVDAEQPVDYSQIGNPFVADATIKMALAKQKADISQTEAQTQLLTGQLESVTKNNELLQRTIDWYKNHPNSAPNVPGMASGNILERGIDLAYNYGSRMGDWLGRHMASNTHQKVHVTESSKKAYFDNLRSQGKLK